MALGNIGAAGAMGVGVASQNAYQAQQAVMGGGGMGVGMAQFMQNQNTYAFSVEKIENGFIVHYGGRKYMSEDLDVAMDQVKTCIVQAKLEG